MSKFDEMANPVGFLYERYPNAGSGKAGQCPIYDVKRTEGKAHAPIFTATLLVPEGNKITSTGSSKKIAKNLAARKMLELLDSQDVQKSPTLPQTVDQPVTGLLGGSTKGPVLTSLLRGEVDEEEDTFSLLERLVEEQNLCLVFGKVNEEVAGPQRWLVQVTGAGERGQEVVTVSMGVGEEEGGAKREAAETILKYIMALSS